MKKSVLLVLSLILVVIVSGCVNSQTPTENSLASEQQTQSNSETTNQQKVSVCEPNWQCSSWSSCTPSGTQTRSCTDSNSCGTNTNKPIESQSCNYVAPVVYNPEYIKLFKIEADSESLLYYFALEDKNGTNVPGEGKANIQIKNTDGKEVFAQEFSFKPSVSSYLGQDNISRADFHIPIDSLQNNILLTDYHIPFVYFHIINSTDIQKGSSSKGTADLTITLSNGKIIKETYSGFSIPSYTHTELEQVWEEEYNNNAKISREVISKGNFEVTLVKYGFYTHFLSNFADDKVTELRADVKIKNVGSVRNKFYTINAKVTSDTKEYKLSFASQLSALDYYIESGFLKEKSLMFSGVPQNLTGQIKILAGLGIDETGENSYEFTVSI